MIHWNRFPLLRILLPFMAGICTALAVDRPFHLPLPLFAVITFFCGLFALYGYKYVRYERRWIFGAAVTLFFLLCGYEITIQRTPRFDPDFPAQGTASSRFMALRITGPVSVKERSVKAVAELLAMADSSKNNEAVRWKKISCRAVVYFEKDSTSTALRYGDMVMAEAPLREVAPPQNPYQYDYKNYLANKGVYHQAYVRSGNWRLISSGHVNKLYESSNHARDKLLAIFEQNNLSGREYAVISALLIGYTEMIDAELMKDYSGTGAMHILSVSGMHVGIVFVVMNMLLFFLDKNKYLKILKGFILLVFVWSYAMVTGMSPCILRAATTFSFIIIGRVTLQQSNIWNMLAASVLCLLLVDPYFITDVGFQLSYLAVIGIVAMYEPIYKLWRPRYRLIEKIWSLIAVSVAAQLSTFPLGLVYFHQFPNYFLLTNLVAVPLSTLIIYCGMAVIGFSFVPVLPLYIGKVTSWLIWLMNTILHYMEGLPYAVSRGIVLNVYEMAMLYAAMILLFAWLWSRKHKLLAASLLLFVLLTVSFTRSNYQHRSQHAITVYSISKCSGADLISGKTAYFIADTGLVNNQSKQDFSIQGNRWHRGIAKSVPIRSCDSGALRTGCHSKGNFILFCGKRIALLDSWTANTKKISVDYLIITGNIPMTTQEILAQYTPALIILSSAVPARKNKEWIRGFAKAGVACYSVFNSGAFVTEF